MYFQASIDLLSTWRYYERVPVKVVAITTSTLLGALVLWRIRARPSTTNITSVSGAIPLLGNAWQMIKDSNTFIENCQQKYGPVFCIRIPINRQIYTVTGELISEMLKLPVNVASLDRGIEDLFPIDQVIYWNNKHKYKLDEITERPAGVAITHKNLRADNIHFIMDRMVHVIDDTLHKQLNLRQGETKLVFLDDLIPRILSNISARCLIGTKYVDTKKMTDVFFDMQQDFWKCMRFYPVLPRWMSNGIARHFLSLSTNMDTAMNQLLPVLEDLRSGKITIEEPTYLKFFLNHPLSDGSRRSAEDAALQIMRALVGTVKLRIFAISFALHELACRPHLVQELRNEIKRLGDYTPATIGSIRLLDSFVREVMRSNANPLMHYRCAQKDIVLSTGHLIPKGSILAGGFGSKQREPNPTHCKTPLDQFDPHRYMFTGGNREWDSITVNQQGYYGFGYGSHPCRGRYFGIQELKYILAEVVANYNIRTRLNKRANNNIIMGLVVLPPTEPLIFERI